MCPGNLCAGDDWLRRNLLHAAAQLQPNGGYVLDCTAAPWGSGYCWCRVWLQCGLLLCAGLSSGKLLHPAQQHHHLLLKQLQVRNQVQHRVTDWRFWDERLLRRQQGAASGTQHRHLCLQQLC